MEEICYSNGREATITAEGCLPLNFLLYEDLYLSISFSFRELNPILTN